MDAIVQFGPQQQLTGVLTGGATATRTLVLVLPNAGLLPRAGPFRLHVELGRRLALQGLRTFRFDVPGVGEAPRMDGCGPHEATQAALDHLALHHGMTEFVVGGVCSAADTAWHVALEDKRVAGVLMLDGVSFTGPWYHLALVMGVLQRPINEWLGVFKRWRARNRMRSQTQERAPMMDDYRDWPSRPEAQRQFAQLVARKVRSLWVYTGGYTDKFLHRRQFGWAFGARVLDPLVSMHYWPDCDHTFYARVHRNRLLDTVDAWLANGFSRTENVR